MSKKIDEIITYLKEIQENGYNLGSIAGHDLFLRPPVVYGPDSITNELMINDAVNTARTHLAKMNNQSICMIFAKNTLQENGLYTISVKFCIIEPKNLETTEEEFWEWVEENIEDNDGNTISSAEITQDVYDFIVGKAIIEDALLHVGRESSYLLQTMTALKYMYEGRRLLWIPYSIDDEGDYLLDYYGIYDLSSRLLVQ